MVNRKNIIIFSISICIFSLFFITIAHPVSANIWDSIWSDGGDQETVNFLIKYDDFLSYGNFLTVTFTWIGWIFIKGLYFLTSAVEGLIPETFNLLDFLDDEGVQGITKAVINDLVVVLMVLTLVYLGFKTIIAKEPPNFKSVGVNIFISAFLILGMPTLMSTMQDMSIKFYNSTQTGTNNGQVKSLAWNLIQENTADLLYVSSRGFSILDDPSSKKNSLTPDSFNRVNLTALITPDKVAEVEGNEVKNLAYKLDTDENGKDIADKIEGSAFSFFSDSFDEGYFRYPAKFIPIIIGLAGLFVAYVFTLFVIVTTIIEIGIKKVVGLFVFATDLENGQRTKMVVQDIMNAFMLIAFTGLGLKMYTLFLSFLGNKQPNIFVYTVGIIAATFVLIKGSNTIMRYFGVDVGLKEGFGQLAGAFAVGKTLSDLSKPFKYSNKSTPQDPKSNLPGQGEDKPKSINDLNGKGLGALKNSVNSAGKSFGYMKTRGISGMTEDAIKGTGEKIATGLAQKGKSLSDSAKGIKDSWKEGVEQGQATGESNREKWNGKPKSVNDSKNQAAIESLNSGDPLKNGVKQANRDGQLRTTGEDSIQSINSVKGASNALVNARSNPTLNESNMTDSTMVNKKVEATGNLKLNTEPTKSINPEGTTGTAHNGAITRQTIARDVQTVSNYQTPAARQTVTQDVQSAGFGNGNSVRQPVVQDIRTSSISTPQQAQQNVEQVLSKYRLPAGAYHAVQKVFQEVQNSPSSSPDALKTKVIQELENTPFGTKEPIKQMILQNVQKSFSATPEQLQQNIKQTVEKAENTTSSLNVQQEVKARVTEEITATHEQKDKPTYFGSLFGEPLESYKDKERKRPSRFDFIKHV